LAYHKRRKVQQAKSSLPCEFDFLFFNTSEQVLWEEEESCRVSDEEDGEIRICLSTRPRKKTADDMYKDDFSSDEEEKQR